MKEFPLLSEMQNRFVKVGVPWEMAESARKQIEHNHGQTLERLAARGGLSYAELYCGVKGLSIGAILKNELPSDEQIEFVIKGMAKLLQEAHGL